MISYAGQCRKGYSGKAFLCLETSSNNKVLLSVSSLHLRLQLQSFVLPKWPSLVEGWIGQFSSKKVLCHNWLRKSIFHQPFSCHVVFLILSECSTNQMPGLRIVECLEKINSIQFGNNVRLQQLQNFIFHKLITVTKEPVSSLQQWMLVSRKLSNWHFGLKRVRLRNYSIRVGLWIFCINF